MVYTPTMRDVHLQKRFIRESVAIQRWKYRVIATDNVCFLRDKTNSFVLFHSGRGKGGGLWPGKVLLLLSICVKGIKENQWYAFLQHMEVTRPLDMVDEMLWYVCSIWSLDDAVHYSLWQVISYLEEGGLTVGGFLGWIASRLCKAV